MHTWGASSLPRWRARRTPVAERALRLHQVDAPAALLDGAARVGNTREFLLAEAHLAHAAGA